MTDSLARMICLLLALMPVVRLLTLTFGFSKKREFFYFGISLIALGIFFSAAFIS